MKKWSHYLILGVILLLAGTNFFYHLGQSSLVSWDEAWYGSIAKNLLSSNNIFTLSYENSPFYDHPPAGFWLITIFMNLFGKTEFGVRAASAVFALFTIIVTYLLGKHLFHSSVGLASGIALISSPWFVYRARSGNLDIFLTFFFIFTFYLALLTYHHRRLFPLFLLSLGLLFLTKSTVPFTLLPALIYIFRHHLKYLFISLLTIPITLLAWFLNQPTFPLGQYLAIGLPQVQTQTNFLANLNLIKAYLHFGLGDWFRPAVLTFPIGLFISRKNLPLLIFLVSFLTPFFFSSKGQIWHLIPSFPFLLLICFSVIYSIFSRFRFPHSSFLLILLTLLFSLPQLSRNWREFIDIPAFISDEAILSREAGNYPQPLLIDEDFKPAAVFYSNKSVYRVSQPSLLEIFSVYPEFLLITHDWRLSRDQVPPATYRILKKDRDRVLIQKNLTPSSP